MIAVVREVNELEELWINNKCLEGVDDEFIQKHLKVIESRKSFRESKPTQAGHDHDYYHFTIFLKEATDGEILKVRAYINAIGHPVAEFIGAKSDGIYKDSYMHFKTLRSTFGNDRSATAAMQRITSKVTSHLDRKRVTGYCITIGTSYIGPMKSAHEHVI